MGILGICFGTSMISRPILGCSHWWEFVDLCVHSYSLYPENECNNFI